MADTSPSPSPSTVDAVDDPMATLPEEKKPLKRKRRPPSLSLLTILSPQDKHSRISSLTREMDALFSLHRHISHPHLPLSVASAVECSSTNAAIARLLEESCMPLSKLVDEIHAKLKERAAGAAPPTHASVKSGVLFVGQRAAYGVPNPDADVLEDDSPSSLWCWETRDLKLLPRSLHGTIKIRRMCRKKIHERLSALSAMVNALQKPENDPRQELDLLKASDKLGKALGEADIRLLFDTMLQKNQTEMAEKEAKLDQKAFVKQLEKSKREVEKEKKRMDRELQKEKLRAEKELKRLQEESEKEEKRYEKEERRKQQEEAKKDQRRREKEEAELKKQLAIQKQVSVMERFLKRSKTTPPVQIEKSSSCLPPSTKAREPEAVTCSMDFTFSSNQEIDIDDIWKFHLSSWHRLGKFIRSNQEQHWGIRRKPKTEVFKELKLTTSNATKEVVQEDDVNIEKLVDGWKERISEAASASNAQDSPHLGTRKCIQRKQLLQFAKSYRPAFYGIWTRKSEVVGPRHPLRKDPALDYDVDSDEEWEEEDPGESLSDCDKDDEESIEDGCSKADEDESEDGFFVPDGYLSDNEGVQDDKMETDIQAEGLTLSSEQDLEHEDFSALFQQHKHLQNMTEHALHKSQPLVILNLSHEKSTQSVAEEMSGTQKLEYVCLAALSMRILPGAVLPEIVMGDRLDVDQVTPALGAANVPDSDLPTIVSTIQSCPQGINKVVESLQQKLPAIPKTLLRSKVREISDFVDSRWQVKKEILDKLGLPISPERNNSSKAKSIAAFFSKRCLPPVEGSMNVDKISSSQPS